MAKRNKVLEAALASAAAMFVSMPLGAGAQTTVAVERARKRRCTAPMPGGDRVGPIPVTDGMTTATVSFWRPKIGHECGADVRVHVLDLETGEPITPKGGERAPRVGDGEGVAFPVRVPSTTRLIGARVEVSPARQLDVAELACLTTFPFRLSLQTVDEFGNKASNFYEAWPCKWRAPDRLLDPGPTK